MGYDENKCTQPWIFPLTLKLLVSIPPIIFVLISLIFLHYYPITEKSIEITKQKLAEKRCVCVCVCVCHCVCVCVCVCVCTYRRQLDNISGGSQSCTWQRSVSFSGKWLKITCSDSGAFWYTQSLCIYINFIQNLHAQILILVHRKCLKFTCSDSGAF